MITKLRRFVERWQMAAVYVALVALVVWGFWSQSEASDRRFHDLATVTRQLRVAEIDRTFRSCEDAVDFRSAFAQFLDQSARPSSAGVDFSQLASFADLDPATKRFLLELAAVQSTGTNAVQSIADRYRERFFPLPDCETNRAKALAKLD